MNASRLRALVVLGTLACAPGAACKAKKKGPDPAPSVSSATTEGAALTGVPVESAPPAPVDPLSRADHALIDRTSTALRELDVLVKKGSLTDLDKPEAGDVAMRCAGLDGERAELQTLAESSRSADASDGDIMKLVLEAQRLCLLEVPLLNADHTLRQVSISPSQASRRLMCGFAQKDLDKVRAAKPNERRLRELDSRFTTTCK